MSISTVSRSLFNETRFIPYSVPTRSKSKTIICLTPKFSKFLAAKKISSLERDCELVNIFPPFWSKLITNFFSPKISIAFVIKSKLLRVSVPITIFDTPSSISCDVLDRSDIPASIIKLRLVLLQMSW